MNQIALRSIPINNNQIVRPGTMIRFLRSNGYQKNTFLLLINYALFG